MLGGDWGEGRFKKPRGPRHWPVGVAADLIGRSAGAAAWFKNTKGAGPAVRWAARAGSVVGPSALPAPGRGRPRRQRRPLPPWGGGRGAAAAGCKTGVKVGFRLPIKPRSWGPPSQPGSARRGVGAAVVPASGSSRGSPRKQTVWFVAIPGQRELLLPSPRLEGFGRARGCL